MSDSRFALRASCFALRASCFALRASCFALGVSCLALGGCQTRNPQPSTPNPQLPTINPLHDDFNGSTLDDKKWTDWVSSFQGRSRGFLFARDNVSVTNGCLNLTARFLRDDEKTVENTRRGFTTYATAYVRSKEKTFYGEYTCRAKTMSSRVCNAFWLYDPLSDKPERKFRPGDVTEEVDIFEIFGSLREWYGTVHCLMTPYLEGIVNGGVVKLPNRTKKIRLDFDPAADFHVYGFRWTETTLTWLIDGKEVFSRENDRFHRPMHITFDCEIMFTWPGIGEPPAAELPAVFSIDYFDYRPAAH